jgi:hypothetical protein
LYLSASIRGDIDRTATGVNHNRVFRADTLFIRTKNTVGARSAQVLQNLRGREPVRADRRLRTDKKRIRTQAAIFNEPLVLISK